MGSSGLVWPNSEIILAEAASAHNVPYVLSTVANTGLEEIRAVAAENAWFQLYRPKDPAVLESLLGRCRDAGYETIVLTVDVPDTTLRDGEQSPGATMTSATGSRCQRIST